MCFATRGRRERESRRVSATGVLPTQKKNRSLSTPACVITQLLEPRPSVAPKARFRVPACRVDREESGRAGGVSLACGGVGQEEVRRGRSNAYYGP